MTLEIDSPDVDSTANELKVALSEAIFTDPKVAPALAALLQKVQSGELEGLDNTDTLTTLAEKVAPYTADANEAKAELAARKEAFITKYEIEVLGKGQVAVNLNETTRIAFFREAQDLARELHGQNAIYTNRLEQWAQEEKFQASPENPLRVDGNVAKSTNMARTEQEEKGWNNVDIEDLAVAHTAYFIATGKDLFDGKIVRARGGALYFCDDGLDVISDYDDIGFS